MRASSFDRNNGRQKLYTGQTRVVNGRGGGPVPEPDLIETWPVYLDAELAAPKPTISLPDVADMLEAKQTPTYNAMKPRALSEAELAVIKTWYEKASNAHTEKVGAQLAAVQNGIMAHASANHHEQMQVIQEIRAHQKQESEDQKAILEKKAKLADKQKARNEAFAKRVEAGDGTPLEKKKLRLKILAEEVRREEAEARERGSESHPREEGEAGG